MRKSAEWAVTINQLRRKQPNPDSSSGRSKQNALLIGKLFGTFLLADPGAGN
jgi:hypothetical protein